MGFARNASAGDKRSRWASIVKASETKGVPIPGTGGHHRWRNSDSGSNRAGLLTGKVPWGSGKGDKQHDTQHNTNNAARQQVLAEQLADFEEQQMDDVLSPYRETDDDYYPDAEEAGLDSLADMPPGVTFNGQSAEDFAITVDWDPYCWCGECALGREISKLKLGNAELRRDAAEDTAAFKAKNAEIERLKAELSAAQASYQRARDLIAENARLGNLLTDAIDSLPEPWRRIATFDTLPRFVQRLTKHMENTNGN